MPINAEQILGDADDCLEVDPVAYALQVQVSEGQGIKRTTYGLNRTKMKTLTGISGTINVGDEVTGGTSGKKAKVKKKNGGDELEVSYSDGAFTDGEALTFDGGASATLGTWDEGDVLELMRHVKDEYLEGMEEEKFEPGGSKKVAKGLYFRAIGYNADDTNELRMKVQLNVGKE